MKRFLICVLVVMVSSVACSTSGLLPVSPGSERDALVKRFVDAVVALDSDTALRYTLDLWKYKYGYVSNFQVNLDSAIRNDKKYGNACECEIANLSSRPDPLPVSSPADKANGIGESLWYDVSLLCRKNTSTKWYDGNFMVTVTSIKERWYVTSAIYNLRCP